MPQQTRSAFGVPKTVVKGCSIEEMSAGYADTLMTCSPVWAFPVVVVLGIAASIGIANLTAKLFKLKKK